MVSRWDNSRDNRCPNCGQVESAAHLNRCPDEWRTRLYRDTVADLQKWLDASDTHPELAYWLPKYALLRGTRRLSSFPYLSADMRRAAEGQDKIPWKDFMEGRVATTVFRLQEHHLRGVGSRLTIGDWSKRLIGRLLDVTHAQWIHRNVSLHDEHSGYLRLRRQEDMMLEIERLMSIPPSHLPSDARYLLELDLDTLATASPERQAYWLYAMKAARRAGRRTRAATRRLGPRARAKRITARLGKRLRPKLSLGSLEVERQIEQDFGLRRVPSRKRKSLRASELEYPSNRRKHPD